MIGLLSFLLELAFPTFLCVMAVALLVEVVRKRSPGGALGLLLVLGFGALVGTRCYHQVQSRRYLQSLSAADIRRIRIGEHRITRPEQITAVVEALNEVEWFSANHGGWGKKQWLVLEFKAGHRRAFPVAKYHREEGAVIEFGRPPGGGAFHDGYAFSRRLPTSLAVLGISLEPESRTEGAATEAQRTRRGM
jgi:hypothetical protein